MAIHIDNTSFSFPYSGGTSNTRFHSDGDLTNFIITKSSTGEYPYWLTIESAYNNRVGRINITAERNTGALRTATIHVQAHESTSDQDVEATINVTQSKGELTGNVELYSSIVDNDYVAPPITVDENEHTLTIRLKASVQITNVDANFSESWCNLIGRSVNILQSDTNYNIWEFIYNIQDNNGITSRTGQLSYDATDMYGVTKINAITINLTQNANTTPYIYADNIIATYNSQRLLATLTVRNATVTSYTTTDSWISNITYDDSDNSLTFDISSNINNEYRQGSITISGASTIDPTETVTFTLYIKQARSKEINILPIWKDYLIDLTLSPDYELDNIYYVVYANDKIIYNGHAYFINDANADETTIPQINITEIVRDYLYDTTIIPAPSILYNTTDFLNVEVFSGETINEMTEHVASLTYYYDYTFKTNEILFRNDPIFHELDPRQYLTLSLMKYIGAPETLWITRDHEISTTDLDKSGINHYIDRVNMPSGVLRARYEGTTISYNVKYSCSKYCLYYLNLLGGWDSLLFEGNNLESEQYDIKTATREIINTTKDFEKHHYLKNITNTYKLTTRYLTDEESEKMINVLRSPRAYLHNLETDEIIPVLINNKNTDIKTFMNQRRKLYTYTLELEASQQKFIKND